LKSSKKDSTSAGVCLMGTWPKSSCG